MREKNCGEYLRCELDRRMMFSRNVFCGATKPRLPPGIFVNYIQSRSIQYTGNRIKKPFVHTKLDAQRCTFIGVQMHTQKHHTCKHLLSMFLLLSWTIDDLWFLLVNLIRKAQTNGGVNRTFFDCIVLFKLSCFCSVNASIAWRELAKDRIQTRTLATNLLFRLTCAPHSILLSCTNICYQLDDIFRNFFLVIDFKFSNWNRCNLWIGMHSSAWKTKEI